MSFLFLAGNGCFLLADLLSVVAQDGLEQVVSVPDVQDFLQDLMLKYL